MKNYKMMHLLTALLVVGLLAMVGCDEEDNNGTDEGADAAEELNDQADGEVAVDISEFGMQGAQFTGEATLTDGELYFEDSELEISTIVFSLNTGVLVLDEFDNPALEYDGQTARMLVHISGEVQDHSPGEVVMSVTAVSPRMLDADDQALGTDSAEQLIDELAANGVTFPEVSTADPLDVTFNISATDEDYEQIIMTSDADFFQRFEGRR